ncbi:hypothetical protein Tco_0506400 [Tanacetum coccineum]
MSITSSNKPRLSKAENSTLPNHDTDKVPLDESERNTTDPSVVISDSSMTDYDSADESSVCSIPLPPVEKLAGAEPVFGLQTIKSNFKVKFTFKAKILKSVIINEPSSAPAKGNISTLVSKTNSAPASKLKNVKIEDDPPLTIVYQPHTGQGESFSRSRSSRSAIPFPFCIHYGYNDHQSDDLGIKPRNPQHVTKNYETCGSNIHTIFDNNDIEWFRKREALQAKKVETLKTSKTESSSALRSKTPTKTWVSKQN